MNSLYKRFDISSPFAQFLFAINNNDTNEPLVNASIMYPNHVPTFTNFMITEESKDILRNYSESDINNNEIEFNDIALPFIPDNNDIFAIYDTYTMQDDNNYRSIINFNYFYNPTITNFMKMCRIKQYILNDKIIFTDKYVFVNVIIADMLRRIRFVIDMKEGKLYTYMYIFDTSIPIIDTIHTSEDLDNMLQQYGNELYDNSCDESKIEVIVSDVTGDYDNESQIGNKISRKKTIGRKTVYNDQILEESEESDSDDLTTPTISSIKKTTTKKTTKPIGRKTVYNDQILEESDSDSDSDNETLPSVKTMMTSVFNSITKPFTNNSEESEESDSDDLTIPSIKKTTTKKTTTKKTTKPIGRMTVYNDQILEESDSDSDSDYTDFDITSDEDSYEYTMENQDKPFEDNLRLQALWTVVDNKKLRNKLLQNEKFLKWYKDNSEYSNEKDFLIALLRGKYPLNTENVDGVVFFDNLDVIDFMNVSDFFTENNDTILDDFNKKFGHQIVWDDGMAFEDAYPNVYEWIKTTLNLD